MDSLAVFFDETLGRLLWLSVAGLLLFIGLHSTGGAAGIALATTAVVPLWLMMTGSRTLIACLRYIARAGGRREGEEDDDASFHS